MKIGFIGAGKMACALVRGLIEAGVTKPEEIIIHDRYPDLASGLARETGVRDAATNDEAARLGDVVVLCVKPGDIKVAIFECKDALRGKLLISIAAGVGAARLQELTGDDVRIVRAMPNLAVEVKQAAIGYAGSAHTTANDLAVAGRIFGSVGYAFEVAEKDLDAVTGLSGSGPAYAFLVIEALSDGGVAAGLPRALATRLAAQILLGAGQMVIELGSHPALLREAVTSPAGTTAAALAVLEDAAVRSAFIEAVCAAADRSRELGG